MNNENDHQALSTGWRCLGVFVIGSVAGGCYGASGLPVVNSSDLTATALLVTGVVFLLLEIKIVSQGILGFLGSALLVAAAVMIWQDGTPFWGIPVGWIIPVIGMVIVLSGILGWLAVQAQKEKVVMGYQGYIGEIAEVCEDLGPEGRVFFNGTYWKAVSAVPVAAGQKVRIIAADRLKLVVEPLSVATSEELILKNQVGPV